jgi:hypothetical protein
MRPIRFTPLVSLLALASLQAVAQESPATIDPMFRSAVEEKLHRTDADDAVRDDHAPGDAPLARPEGAGIESRIGVDNAPESEVHAAMNPTDSSNIVVAPIRLDPQTGHLDCPIYYTRDFGATWRRSSWKVTLKNPSHLLAGGGDPVFAFDADGTAYFTWIAMYSNATYDSVFWGMYWARSTDGGATWLREENDVIAEAKMKPPLPAPYGFYFLPVVYDKQWMAADRTNSPYRNTIYTVLVAMSPTGVNAHIVVIRKAKGDAPVSEPVEVSDGSFTRVQFSSIDVDRAGSVHVSFFGTKDDATYGLYHSRSDDGGATFSPATKISDLHIPRFSPDAVTDSILGVAKSRLYPCPHIVVDKGSGPNAGTVYAVWSADGIDARSPNGMDIFFSRSSDNGTSWSEPIVVNDDARGVKRNQFHPSLAVSPNGIVTVTWYDRRASSNDRMTTYYIAHSYDGGRTFSTNRAVSDVTTDFATVGRQNGGFGIGEYTQVIATDSYAMPFWADGRGNNGDLNVYTALVPITDGASSVERFASVSSAVTLSARVEAPATIDIVVTLARAADVRLRLFDARGAELRTIASESMDAGQRHVRADAGDLAAGQYFVRAEAGQDVVTQSIRIIR